MLANIRRVSGRIEELGIVFDSAYTLSGLEVKLGVIGETLFLLLEFTHSLEKSGSHSHSSGECLYQIL